MLLNHLHSRPLKWAPIPTLLYPTNCVVSYQPHNAHNTSTVPILSKKAQTVKYTLTKFTNISYHVIITNTYLLYKKNYCKFKYYVASVWTKVCVSPFGNGKWKYYFKQAMLFSKSGRFECLPIDNFYSKVYPQVLCLTCNVLKRSHHIVIRFLACRMVKLVDWTIYNATKCRSTNCCYGL